MGSYRLYLSLWAWSWLLLKVFRPHLPTFFRLYHQSFPFSAFVPRLSFESSRFVTHFVFLTSSCLSALPNLVYRPLGLMSLTLVSHLTFHPFGLISSNGLWASYLRHSSVISPFSLWASPPFQISGLCLPLKCCWALGTRHSARLLSAFGPHLRY